MSSTETVETSIVKKPPASRITITLDQAGTEKTVFMSFALLNELTPLVGGPERMAEFDFDARLREHTLILCLGDRGPNRKILESYQLPEEREMDQAELLMDWAKEHVLNFFIRRLIKNLDEFRSNTDALRLVEKLPHQIG